MDESPEFTPPPPPPEPEILPKQEKTPECNIETHIEKKIAALEVYNTLRQNSIMVITTVPAVFMCAIAMYFNKYAGAGVAGIFSVLALIYYNKLKARMMELKSKYLL